jgi:hypothetical protein
MHMVEMAAASSKAKRMVWSIYGDEGSVNAIAPGEVPSVI